MRKKFDVGCEREKLRQIFSNGHRRESGGIEKVLSRNDKNKLGKQLASRTSLIVYHITSDLGSIGFRRIRRHESGIAF